MANLLYFYSNDHKICKSLCSSKLLCAVMFCVVVQYSVSLVYARGGGLELEPIHNACVVLCLVHLNDIELIIKTHQMNNNSSYCCAIIVAMIVRVLLLAVAFTWSGCRKIIVELFQLLLSDRRTRCVLRVSAWALSSYSGAAVRGHCLSAPGRYRSSSRSCSS